MRTAAARTARSTAARTAAPRTAAREWPLWSTTARLVVGDPDALDDALTIADDLLGAVDRAASRFRGDAELLARRDDLVHGAEVSPLLADLVGTALEAARVTDGAVDPTLGWSLDGLGYDRDIRLLERDDRPIRAVVAPRPGWRSIRLQGRRLTVPAHLALDLGATAKARAADLLAARVAADLRVPVLVSLGGDIATAGPEPADGWTVTVRDAEGEPAARIRLRAGAGLATSSTQRRRWERGGRILHHIVDPATGMPAAPVWRTVTVAASSCVAANTRSTAAVVRGLAAPAVLAGHAARLVDADGRISHLGGWPADAELAEPGPRSTAAPGPEAVAS